MHYPRYLKILKILYWKTQKDIMTIGRKPKFCFQCCDRWQTFPKVFFYSICCVLCWIFGSFCPPSSELRCLRFFSSRATSPFALFYWFCKSTVSKREWASSLIVCYTVRANFCFIYSWAFAKLKFKSWFCFTSNFRHSQNSVKKNRG